MACSACVGQKIRCEGGPPCTRCAKQRLPCNKKNSPSRVSSRPKRRQDTSCDQCRNSRRACDGFPINEQRKGNTTLPPWRCTACTRGMKKCTFSRTLSKAKAQSKIAMFQPQPMNVNGKHLIICLLLQGYRGIFESSFWFLASERNCPYQDETTTHPLLYDEAFHPRSHLESMVRDLDSRGFLSSSEKKSARRALNMAILAFTSQWLVDTSPRGGRFDTGYQVIRTALWHHAITQIQNCTGMSSFQAMLATIILALTHPPPEAAEKINLSTAKRAITKLFELKEGLNLTSSDDHQSINILFWFGLVFDTISSASKICTLAIPDENCMILHRGQKSELWRLSTFQARRRDHSQTKISLLHEEAVPISILLIRKSIHLREQIDLGSPPAELERCISECLSIHDYWFKAYHGIMDHYLCFPSSYPWRLLSWLVCLRIRWSWSCLILVEIIRNADGSGRTTDFGRMNRVYTTREIGKQNAELISDVARASVTPGPKATLIGFGLLNDPWTGLFIEAMKLALKFLSPGSGTDDGSLDERRQSCEDCISLLASRSASIKCFQATAHMC